jgi:hypothetical protein
MLFRQRGKRRSVSRFRGRRAPVQRNVKPQPPTASRPEIDAARSPGPEMPANLGKTTFNAYILGMLKRAIRGRKSPLFLQQSGESTS